MMSQSTPNSWDFTDALDLLHTLQQPRTLGISIYVPEYPVSPGSSSSGSLSGDSKRPATLGNFDRVFRNLKKTIAIDQYETQGGSLDEGSSVSDAETTPPSTPRDCETHQSVGLTSTKEVRWTDLVHDIGGGDTHELKSNPCSPSIRKSLSSSSLTRLEESNELRALEGIQKKLDDTNYSRHRRSKSLKGRETGGKTSIFVSEADENTVDWWLKESEYERCTNLVKLAARTAPVSALPSVKQPHSGYATPPKAQPKLWLSPVCIDSGTIKPMLNLTRQEKKTRLVRRLEEKFGGGFLQHLDLPRSLFEYGGGLSDGGIHVFVDSSNIAIGFYDALKLARGIPVRSYTKRAPMSFHSLVLLMERGRDVAKRVLVGSSDRGGELPGYMQEAAHCGYEINSLDRVEKFKETRSSGKKSRSGNGYGTSGQSSGSETPLAGTRKVTEQGVDEILHMKMLESIVDSKKPTTIVLATGDAAEAEYSGGFLKNVERALSKGWKVELVAWGHSMSYAYRSREFLQRWKDQFKVIELDDFSEELLGHYIETSSNSHAQHTRHGADAYD